MHIGVPKEIKTHQHRLALTPAGVHELAGRVTCEGVAETLGCEYVAPAAALAL